MLEGFTSGKKKVRYLKELFHETSVQDAFWQNKMENKINKVRMGDSE